MIIETIEKLTYRIPIEQTTLAFYPDDPVAIS